MKLGYVMTIEPDGSGYVYHVAWGNRAKGVSVKWRIKLSDFPRANWEIGAIEVERQLWEKIRTHVPAVYREAQAKGWIPILVAS